MNRNVDTRNVVGSAKCSGLMIEQNLDFFVITDIERKTAYKVCWLIDNIMGFKSVSQSRRDNGAPGMMFINSYTYNMRVPM